MEAKLIDYHAFLDHELGKKGFSFISVSEEYMRLRLRDVMQFVNGIRSEYSDQYGWQPENEAYFLNGLDRKWDFSFAIEEISSRRICALNISSVYGDIIHNHCTYVDNKHRGQGFAKFYALKECQMGLDAGFTCQEAYFPINNNGSIILHLKMGWKIKEIRKNGTQLFMIADLREVRDKTYYMLLDS